MKELLFKNIDIPEDDKIHVTMSYNGFPIERQYHVSDFETGKLNDEIDLLISEELKTRKIRTGEDFKRIFENTKIVS